MTTVIPECCTDKGSPEECIKNNHFPRFHVESYPGLFAQDALFSCIRFDRPAIMEELIKNHPVDVNAPAPTTMDGAIHLACELNRVACLELLVKYGANVESTNTPRKSTPLCVAIRFDSAECVRYLVTMTNVKIFRQKTFVTDGDLSPIHAAAKYDRVDVMDMLFSKASCDNMLYRSEFLHPIVDTRHANGCACGSCGNGEKTPMCVAAQSGAIHVVKYLLNKGFDPRKVIDKDGDDCESFFHLACWNSKNAACIKALLEHDPTLVHVKNGGLTPLYYAIIAEQLDIFNLLATYHPDVRERLEEIGYEKLRVRSYLQLAVRMNSPAIIQRLIEMGADINEVFQPENKTTLHVAIRTKNTALVQWLIEHGADVHSLASAEHDPAYVWSCVEMANYVENNEITNMLLRAGATWWPAHHDHDNRHCLISEHSLDPRNTAREIPARFLLDHLCDQTHQYDDLRVIVYQRYKNVHGRYDVFTPIYYMALLSKTRPFDMNVCANSHIEHWNFGVLTYFARFLINNGFVFCCERNFQNLLCKCGPQVDRVETRSKLLRKIRTKDGNTLLHWLAAYFMSNEIVSPMYTKMLFTLVNTGLTCSQSLEYMQRVNDKHQTAGQLWPYLDCLKSLITLQYGLLCLHQLSKVPELIIQKIWNDEFRARYVADVSWTICAVD